MCLSTYDYVHTYEKQCQSIPGMANVLVQEGARCAMCKVRHSAARGWLWLVVPGLASIEQPDVNIHAANGHVLD